MKTKILFICLGNICRSPAAEDVFRQMAEERSVGHLFEIDSAGIGAWHTGQLPDRRMRQTGALRGYTFAHHARQIRERDFSHFDLIIGMDKENMTELRHLRQRCHEEAKARLLCLADFLQHHPGQQTIPDPYYGGQRDFDFALDLIEDACRGLLDELLLAH